MANPIRVVGVGPGNPEYLTLAVMDVIKTSDILVGGERVLKPFMDLGCEIFTVKNNLSQMVKFIRDRYLTCRVTVLASGDPGFYGILEHLKKHFKTEDIEVYPGLSSIQLACARLCISWHDAVFYSLHGRKIEGLDEIVEKNSKVIVLTDPQNTPARICAQLRAAGLVKKKVYICENLSYENEKVNRFDINNVPENAGAEGCVMVINDE